MGEGETGTADFAVPVSYVTNVTSEDTNPI